MLFEVNGLSSIKDGSRHIVVLGTTTHVSFLRQCAASRASLPTPIAFTGLLLV
jgi:hypothetical protein